MKKIAFFDFDGTITTHDTMLEIIRFHRGFARFLIGFALLAPYMIGLKLRLVTNQRAKERLLTFFLKGMPEAKFDEVCRKFFETKKDVLIRPKALQRIHELRKAGFEMVIVTASPSAWVRYWAEHLQMSFIATEMEISDGKVTGKLRGPNCNFSEKVNRIKMHYHLPDYSEIHCFGDSEGDREMLGLATHSFYREFH